MANFCEICGKGTMSGMNVSHSHLKTKKTWKPNIQRVRAIVDGEVKRVNVCTRCLRSGKVQRDVYIKKGDSIKNHLFLFSFTCAIYIPRAVQPFERLFLQEKNPYAAKKTP